ncbi:MAG: acyl-CoA dehydrogenase [Desulfobacterales bacterium CG23_combo_of_CG06-09_8_20_14_all_51_8]|nr:MAG: acyl-CoA dehydrogenase [Desulfobacterales bacterium CG23_combo_of_CG06-09_8_20_14_all_51_8]
MKRRIFKKEHDIFRKSFRTYLKDKIIPFYEEWEDAGITPREAWLEAGKNEFLCPTAEEKYGGPGADFLYSTVITEELYYHGLSSLFWPLHSDIVFPYIELYADEAQKKRWVPKCVSGEYILAVAMTEPDAGSDLANLSTRAVRDGDHYIVNGSKIFISNGQLADLCVVAVRTKDTGKPHAGVSLLVIEADRKGFRKGKNLKKIGMRAQDTSELFFDDCRVPVENLLGNEGDGFKYLMHNLQQERLVLAIGAFAAAEGALDITLDYVKSRKLFGTTLSKFQNTRFTLAEVATKVQLARSFLDDLIPRHMAGEDVVREVSMAKYWLTELQFEAADKCLQLFGGYGYMREYLISRLFVDARVQRIYGGANEVLKEVIARRLNI